MVACDNMAWAVTPVSVQPGFGHRRQEKSSFHFLNKYLCFSFIFLEDGEIELTQTGLLPQAAGTVPSQRQESGILWRQGPMYSSYCQLPLPRMGVSKKLDWQWRNLDWHQAL